MQIKAGKRTKTLSEWFDEEPPVIRFEDNTFLIYNEQFRLRNPGERIPYPREQLQAWVRPAYVDITVEFQKIGKRANSVQFYTLRV